MKLKKGDKVMIIAGKEKGKTATISRVLQTESRVLLDGINTAKRHKRATRAGQKGQIVEKAMPIHVSNVMLIDPKSGKRTRVRIERKDGGRVRIAVKSGQELK